MNSRMSSLSQFVVNFLAILCVLCWLLVGLPKARCQAPTRFTVVTEGAAKGPAILLLPGLSSSRAVFDAEAAQLAPSYHLYRLQLNGFAGQPAGANASGPILVPTVEELHQYVVANKLHPVVIGHSLGGLLGLMLAEMHPEDVSKLMLVDTLPFYGLVFMPTATVEMLHPQAQAIHDQMLATPADQFAAMQPMMAAQLVTDPAGQKRVAADAIASDRKVFANAMLEGLSTDLRKELAKVQTPTVVLYPYQASSEGPEAQVTALYTGAFQGMPNVKLVKIDNSKHFILYDQPAAFHQAVLDLLR